MNEGEIEGRKREGGKVEGWKGEEGEGVKERKLERERNIRRIVILFFVFSFLGIFSFWMFRCN